VMLALFLSACSANAHGGPHRFSSQSNVLLRHGPISSCPISIMETMVLEYLALPDDSPARQMMERRLVNPTFSSLLLPTRRNNRTIEQAMAGPSMMACPGCQNHVEKSLGCNHVCLMTEKACPPRQYYSSP
jgi:hypothetical protein